MKTFREFLLTKEGLWQNPGLPDGKGTKRPPQKDLYNSRFDGSPVGNAAAAQPQRSAKTMKKK